jgi:phage terminase large subunit
VLASDRLVNGGRISVKSGHGTGKSCLAAGVSLWFKYAIRPSIVLTTAPTERQVKEILWREIRYRHGQAGLSGKPLTMKLDMNAKEYMLGFSTDDVMQMQGFHAPNILVIIDEANGYPAELFQAVEGWISGGDRVILFMIGNPVSPMGPYFNSFTDGVTDCYTISCLNHPNVVNRRNIIPGAVTYEWVEKQRKTWGEESSFWSSRVIGEFPKISDDTVIALMWVEQAEQIINRCQAKGEGLYLGVDPAEYGDDEYVFYVGSRTAIKEIVAKQHIEPAQCISEVKLLKNKYSIPDANISVDGIGAGATIVSCLHQDGVKCNRVVVSEAAKDSKKFANFGTETWWFARDMLNPNSEIYTPFSFSGKRDMLKADLCTRKFQASHDGRLMLEPKETYRKRMKRSPNYADAFTLAYTPFIRRKTFGLIMLPSVY